MRWLIRGEGIVEGWHEVLLVVEIRQTDGDVERTTSFRRNVDACRNSRDSCPSSRQRCQQTPSQTAGALHLRLDRLHMGSNVSGRL